MYKDTDKCKDHIKEKKNCALISGGTQPECFNKPVEIHSVNKHHYVTAKIPVVLTELKVQINVHSTITLPEKALEVKRIKKRLKVTQCRLIKAIHQDDHYEKPPMPPHMPCNTADGAEFKLPCHKPYPPPCLSTNFSWKALSAKILSTAR